MTANSQPAVNEYRLNEDNELRLELSNDDVVIELLDGTAELFGTSLTRHKRYTLPGGFFPKLYCSNFRVSRGHLYVSRCRY